jgi:hypothetical protein
MASMLRIQMSALSIIALLMPAILIGSLNLADAKKSAERCS